MKEQLTLLVKIHATLNEKNPGYSFHLKDQQKQCQQSTEEVLESQNSNTKHLDSSFQHLSKF
jgi:hypothetical protein